MKKLLLSSLLVLPTILGCTTKDSSNEDDNANLAVYTQSAKADNSGLVNIDVDINNHRSFMITAEAGQGVDYVSVEQVYAPNGKMVLNWEDWYDGKDSLTYAFYADVDTVLNYPIRKDEGALQNGTYTVVVGAYKEQGQGLYYAPSGGVDVTVHRRKDAEPNSGSIKAVVVYTKGLSSDPIVSAGVRDAVAYWKQIWGSKNLELSVRYESTNISTDLPFPGYGNGQPILEAANLTDGEEIVVMIGESIDGDSRSYLGVSGNIPGTLIPTTRSATVISWLANAGVDGKFSEEDVRLFGETLAHEVGHYVGLFHPVEDGWSYWDAISDTDACSSRNQCENALGSNLMFPYPVCSFSDCVAQNDLSSGQQAVMQRYTGTK